MLVGGPADDIRVHKSSGPTLGLLAFREVVQRKIRSNFEKTERLRPKGTECMLYNGEEGKGWLIVKSQGCIFFFLFWPVRLSTYKCDFSGLS